MSLKDNGTIQLMSKRELDTKMRKAHESRVGGTFHFSGSNSGYCSLPISGDTYRNCPHACSYCYEIQTPNQHLRKTRIQPRDHRALFESLYDHPQVRQFIVERQVPVRIGALTDPFPPMEVWYRNTERTIRLLATAGIQVQITTKNPALIDDKHLEALLAAPKAMIRVSFATLEDDRAALLEKGAQPPSVRLEAMRRIADTGVEVGARMSPFVHTQPEGADPATYQTLASAGVSNVTLELLKFSVTWRHSFDPIFWVGALDEECPDYHPSGWRKILPDKKSAMRKWAERMERQYFGPLQNLDGEDAHRYASTGYGFVLFDPHKQRVLYKKVRDAAHSAGLRWGICSFSDGMPNIDLNDGPDEKGEGNCGCLMPGWNYDVGALVPSWHYNQWGDYLMPSVLDYPANVALDRFLHANDATTRPLVLHEKYPTGIVAAAEAIPDEASADVLEIKGAARAYRPELHGKGQA